MKSSELFSFETNIITNISKLYQRTEESLNEDVQNLKNWMQTQAHLPEILDDKSLRNFLILNKCSTEKAKEKIDMYYTIRSKIPDFYEYNNPSRGNIQQAMKMVWWVPLPKLTKEMYRVLFFKVRNKNTVDEMEPRDITALAYNLQEMRLKEDVMFGDVFIFDLEGLTLGYLKKLTPSFVAKVVAIYGKVYSIPLKGIYCINSPPYINTILTILKTLMKPKLFERIHVCENESILEEYFQKEILPKEYGGEEKSLGEIQNILELKLSQYQDRFDLLDKLRVDESLRPKKLENDEILGFHGNFKKLSVD